MQIRMLRDYDRFKINEIIKHHDVVAEAWIRRGLATKDLTLPAVVKPEAVAVPAPKPKPVKTVESSGTEPKPEMAKTVKPDAVTNHNADKK